MHELRHAIDCYKRQRRYGRGVALVAVIHYLQAGRAVRKH